MSNHTPGLQPKDEASSLNSQLEITVATNCANSPFGKTPAQPLLHITAKAHGSANSGYTTPDTFISLPGYRRSKHKTYKSASEALDAYIDAFEGRKKERYYTSSLSNLLSSKPSLKVNSSEGMSKSAGVDNKDLIRWVNRAYEKQLQQTCVPAFGNGYRKVSSSLPKEKALQYTFHGHKPMVSSLPSSPESDVDSIVDGESVTTDHLLLSYNKEKDTKYHHSGNSRSVNYPHWLQGLDEGLTDKLNETRISTVSSLLHSGPSGRDRNKTADKRFTYLTPVAAENRQYFTLDDTESVITDVLLETSVYGQQPVNMGGKLHVPLYQDRKVEQILNNSRVKKKKHRPERSLLSRTIHAGEEDKKTVGFKEISLSQTGPSVTDRMQRSQFLKKHFTSTPLPNRMIVREHPVHNVTKSPTNTENNFRLSSAQSSRTAAFHSSAKLQNRSVRTPNTNSNFLSEMTDVDLLNKIKEHRNSRMSSSTRSSPYSATPGTGDAKESFFGHRGSSHLVSTVSHKTSGYFSGNPSVDATLHTQGERSSSRGRLIRSSSPIPSPVMRKASGSSDASTNTDTMLRTSPTGIKYHSRSKTWSNLRSISPTMTHTTASALNTSAPALTSSNVITRRIAEKKLRNISGPQRTNSRTRQHDHRQSAASSKSISKKSAAASDHVRSMEQERVLKSWTAPTSQVDNADVSSIAASSEYEGDEEEILDTNPRYVDTSWEQKISYSVDSIHNVSAPRTTRPWSSFHHPSYYHRERCRGLQKSTQESDGRESNIPCYGSSIKRHEKESETADESECESADIFRRQLKAISPIGTTPSRNIPIVSNSFFVSNRERKSQTLPLMSDTESEKLSIDTEMLLVQPPMPVVNASPSLSTISGSDTMCESDLESAASTMEDTVLKINMPKIGTTFSSEIDTNHNVNREKVGNKLPSRTTASLHPEHMGLLLGSPNEKGFHDQNSDHSPPSVTLMDSFIADCLTTAQRKQSPRSSREANKKLSGGHHPGPVEALKHMLLNLQNETSSYLATEKQMEHSLRNDEDIFEDEKDDEASLPGEHSLQRAYHHLERLKVLVNERTEKSAVDN